MSVIVHDPFEGPGPDAEFHRRLAAGEFAIQRCDGCGAFVFYPRALCPRCGATELSWVTASGRAAVYATTVVRQRPEQGPDYNVALIELEEGPRLMSRVDGVPPEAVRIGMAVRARIVTEPGGPLLVFMPAEADHG